MNRRRKPQKKGNKHKFYLLISIFTTVSFYIITSDFGLKRLIELKREQAGLEREIHQLTKQQINLNNDISNLKTNIEYIEQIAREKFMMAKPGEKIFRVVEYKTIQ